MRRAVAFALVVAAIAAWGSPARAGAPEYESRIAPIGPATRELMTGRSWRAGCPVGFVDLRIVRMTYWGFDREAHRGRMVVHRWYADEIARVFHRLYDARFPIRRMRLVDHTAPTTSGRWRRTTRRRSTAAGAPASAAAGRSTPTGARST